MEDGMRQKDTPTVSQPGEGEIVRIPLGRDIVIKASGPETGGAYSILEFTAQVGGEWTIPHMHRGEEEGWYVPEGELTFRLADQTVRAPAGSFVLAPRGRLHSFGNTGTETARYLEFFSPPGMERFFSDLAALAAGSPNGQIDPQARIALAAQYGIEYPPSTQATLTMHTR
jgi:mannose-6-phosphate isomerase-like protein (cupin superfamily)